MCPLDTCFLVNNSQEDNLNDKYPRHLPPPEYLVITPNPTPSPTTNVIPSHNHNPNLCPVTERVGSACSYMHYGWPISIQVSFSCIFPFKYDCISFWLILVK